MAAITFPSEWTTPWKSLAVAGAVAVGGIVGITATVINDDGGSSQSVPTAASSTPNDAFVTSDDARRAELIGVTGTGGAEIPIIYRDGPDMHSTITAQRTVTQDLARIYADAPEMYRAAAEAPLRVTSDGSFDVAESTRHAAALTASSDGSFEAAETQRMLSLGN